jgi:hypothetical protein
MRLGVDDTVRVTKTGEMGQIVGDAGSHRLVHLLGTIDIVYVEPSNLEPCAAVVDPSQKKSSTREVFSGIAIAQCHRQHRTCDGWTCGVSLCAIRQVDETAAASFM